MEKRAHPPLRRMTRGEGPLVLVDPSLPAGGKGLPSSSSIGFEGQLAGENDSCYSSCSEESHASLSRESSDALSTVGSGLGSLRLEEGPDAVTPTTYAPPELANFARSLGYTEEQLGHVLARIGPDAGQDRVLAELVKLGKAGELARSWAQPVSSSSEPQLRSIVIDGSNIAMTHGRKEVFSCAGIRVCVEFFLQRGHQDIIIFIPQFRRESARADCPITDQHLLSDLDQQGLIVWTPSRRVNGRRIVCHDDRYILKTAEEKDAVIVSNDEYRDLVRENPQYSQLVEHRLLMYSFVDGRFMPPDDPLGRHGPTLDQFLSKNPPVQATQLCPYARKCTYGNKCKYYHPERPNGVHVSVTDRLMKEKNQKRPISNRPSMQYERLRNSHCPVARTQSLNAEAVYANNQENNPYNRPYQLPLQQQQWHQAAQHQQIGRNQSVPIARRMDSREDMGHLYAPSTAIWGQSELSVGPMMSNGPPGFGSGPSLDQERARLQFNLCQLFPEAAVLAVMAAHPEETSSQVLCEHIIAISRSFK